MNNTPDCLLEQGRQFGFLFGLATDLPSLKLRRGMPTQTITAPDKLSPPAALETQRPQSKSDFFPFWGDGRKEKLRHSAPSHPIRTGISVSPKGRAVTGPSVDGPNVCVVRVGLRLISLISIQYLVCRKSGTYFPLVTFVTQDAFIYSTIFPPVNRHNLLIN